MRRVHDLAELSPNVFRGKKVTLPCPGGLTIIKQSTRRHNTGNLLEKRANAGNYDAPSSLGRGREQAGN